MSSTSQPFSLNRSDLLKIAKNAAIFSAPATLIFLTVIQKGGSINEAMIAVYGWLLNTAIDTLRKYLEGTKRDPSGKFTGK